MTIIKYVFYITLLIFIQKPLIAEDNELVIGLLKYGSVNWEIDIMLDANPMNITSINGNG